jgi:hypothetical protein
LTGAFVVSSIAARMPDALHDSAGDSLELPGWTAREPVPRRASDRSLYQMCKEFFTLGVAVLSFLGLLGAGAGFAMSVMGFSFSGNRQAISDVARSDSTLALRVTRVERRMDGYEHSLKFMSYMLCVQKNGPRDPLAVDRCQPIIDQMRSEAP